MLHNYSDNYIDCVYKTITTITIVMIIMIKSFIMKREERSPKKLTEIKQVKILK